MFFKIVSKNICSTESTCVRLKAKLFISTLFSFKMNEIPPVDSKLNKNSLFPIFEYFRESFSSQRRLNFPFGFLSFGGRKLLNGKFFTAQSISSWTVKGIGCKNFRSVVHQVKVKVE